MLGLGARDWEPIAMISETVDWLAECWEGGGGRGEKWGLGGGLGGLQDRRAGYLR